MDSGHEPCCVDSGKLYSFRDPLAKRPLRLEQFGDDRLTFEQVKEFGSGAPLPQEPIRLRGYMGRQVMDVLWTGSLWFCVSSRVIELLSEHGITGWSTFPVEVYDHQGEPLPGYHGFAITGPTCRRDKSRSQIVAKPPPVPQGEGFDVYRGLYFDENQWDGSDFFWVDRSGGRVVTERVYRLFKRNKISNVRFVPLPEVEIDVLLDRFEKDED